MLPWVEPPLGTKSSVKVVLVQKDHDACSFLFPLWLLIDQRTGRASLELRTLGWRLLEVFNIDDRFSVVRALYFPRLILFFQRHSKKEPLSLMMPAAICCQADCQRRVALGEKHI